MKLTPEFLRKIVLEEKSKLASDTVDADKAIEVDADEHGTDKVKEKKPVDWMKVLNLKEQKAIAFIKKIREAKARLAKKASK